MYNTAALQVQKLRCAELANRAKTEGWLSEETHCNVIWDGLLCWNVTKADQEPQQPCPAYVTGFRTEEMASKSCLEDGTWFLGPLGTPWTNFTLCDGPTAAPPPTLTPEQLAATELFARWMPVLKRMAQIGYTASFVTLLAALCVLSAAKRLRCPRNSLHQHLFVSFLLRALVTLLKDALFVQGLGPPGDVLMADDGDVFFNKGSNWECKLVVSLWQYFIMANYFWILMEGLYLHNLIFLALFSDTSAIRLYVVLGWGLPVLCVAPWVAGRLFLEDEFCWTTNNTSLFLFIRLPITLSVLINFGLFINITRVLLTKLRFQPCFERRKARYRRFARSTLVLVPLFGVHYTAFLGMSYGVDRHPRLELAWLFCDQFFASFQGLFVSLLYCLLNAEVRAELARKWKLLLGGRKRWLLMGSAGGGGAGGVMEALVGVWRPNRGASLTSVLTSDTLVRMAELSRNQGRIRTISASEDDRERIRSAQA